MRCRAASATMTGMMTASEHCRACGAAVGDGASFCAACGNRVERAGAAVVEAKPAAYPRRAAAWLIDLPISLVPVALVYVLALQIPGANEAFYERSLEGATTEVRQITELAFVVLVPLYWALLHAIWHGQTLGKRLLALAVVREGAPISVARSLARSYVQMVFLVMLLVVPLVIDYLWPLGNARRRALHDLVAGTIVIDTRGPAEASTTAAAGA
jgi:uncharacterized RDD family membrane protein YckC